MTDPSLLIIGQLSVPQGAPGGTNPTSCVPDSAFQSVREWKADNNTEPLPVMKCGLPQHNVPNSGLCCMEDRSMNTAGVALPGENLVRHSAYRPFVLTSHAYG